MTIIDETHTYFDHELCIVHGGDKCFDKKEGHPPTSPASSSSSPFHGFNDVPYAENYEKDDTIHERLQEFNNNSLHIYSIGKVAIPPYDHGSFIVRVDASPTAIGSLQCLK